MASRFPYTVILPQARFLDFLAAEGQQYLSFICCSARVWRACSSGTAWFAAFATATGTSQATCRRDSRS